MAVKLTQIQCNAYWHDGVVTDEGPYLVCIKKIFAAGVSLDDAGGAVFAEVTQPQKRGRGKFMS